MLRYAQVLHNPTSVTMSNDKRARLVVVVHICVLHWRLPVDWRLFGAASQPMKLATTTVCHACAPPYLSVAPLQVDEFSPAI